MAGSGIDPRCGVTVDFAGVDKHTSGLCWLTVGKLQVPLFNYKVWVPRPSYSPLLMPVVHPLLAQLLSGMMTGA